MTGYVRKDTTNNIADGNVINAADLDSEFDGVQAAFNSSTGHTHDGSSAEGAPITKLGPVQDVTISTTVLGVKTTNTVDLGTSSLKFKDFYLAGTASIGGALTYGGVTLSNAVTGTGNMVLSASPTLTGTITAAAANFSGAVAFNGTTTIGDADTDTITQTASYVTGTQLKSAKTATNTLSLAAYDVDGTSYTNLITLTASNTPTLALTSTGVGSMDNITVGATTPSTGAFTTLSASSTVTISGGTAYGVAYLSSPGKVLTTGSVLTFDGEQLGVNGITVGRGAGAVSTNTAVGASALAANTSGGFNTAFGYQAGYSNTTGGASITAFGYQAGKATTTGFVTAFGFVALAANTSGANNSAFGSLALTSNTAGSYNTGIGDNALYSNTTASNNTAVGYQAGYTNSTGTRNAMLGYVAGYSMTGNYCTLIGAGAGYSTTGERNTFVGDYAGNLITTGTKNTIIGKYDGNQGGLDIRTASNYIVLSDGDGNPRGIFDSSGKLLVGTTSVTPGSGDNGVCILPEGGLLVTCATDPLYRGYSLNSGSPVFNVANNGNVVNTNNSYGGISDIKLKENVTDSTPKLADLMQVKIRNYNLIGDTTKQIGVVAQELEEVFPSMVDESPDRDAEGNNLGTTTKSVKYSVFVPMLIKAIQEQNQLITSLTERISALENK